MKIIKTAFDTAVMDAFASLTEPTCPLNFAKTEEIILAHARDGDKGVSKLKWCYWTFCIGRIPEKRIKKDANPIAMTEGFVIQDQLPAKDINEIQERVKSFKVPPTIIGFGLLDKLPQYIFQLKEPAEVDYREYARQSHFLADENKVTATKASFSPSTFWMHTGCYLATGAELLEQTTTSDTGKTEDTTATDIENKAYALAKKMWHEANTGTYWFADATGIIRKRQEAHAKAEFMFLGLSGTSRKAPSRADFFLKYVRDNNSVDGVVESPFRPVGPFRYGGRTILNRSQLNALTPAETALAKPDPTSNPRSNHWERFCAYMDALFGPEQLPYVDALMCRTYMSLYEHKELFKQAAIFSGPANAGKTLWISQVLVPLMGGRSGNLKSYLQSPGGVFTENLFSSPVGLLDDQAHDEKDKARFTSALKNLVSSQQQEFHAKFMAEQGIPWQGAVWILCNLDTDSFSSTIPNLGMSILDKLHLFKAHTPVDFDFVNILDDIQNALPYYARYLIDNEAAIMSRVTPSGPAVKYGIQPFHNPDLLENSRMNDSTTQLLEILEALREDYIHVFGSLQKITATQFIAQVSKIDELRDSIKALNPKKVGEALTNLSKIHDWIQVATRIGTNSNRYTIRVPGACVAPIATAPRPAASRASTGVKGYFSDAPTSTSGMNQPATPKHAEAPATEHPSEATPAAWQRCPQVTRIPKEMIQQGAPETSVNLSGQAAERPSTYPSPEDSHDDDDMPF